MLWWSCQMVVTIVVLYKAIILYMCYDLTTICHDWVSSKTHLFQAFVSLYPCCLVVGFCSLKHVAVLSWFERIVRYTNTVIQWEFGKLWCRGVNLVSSCVATIWPAEVDLFRFGPRARQMRPPPPPLPLHLMRYRSTSSRVAWVLL